MLKSFGPRPSRFSRARRSILRSVAIVALAGGPSTFAADVHWTAVAANPDSAAPAPAITAAFVFGGIATDFLFQPAGVFDERDDGTATLTGLLFSQSQPSLGFAIHLQLGGVMKPGDPSYPPTASPKEDLLPGAYLQNGGPVDPSTWRYYTTGGGMLVGLSSLEGATVQIALHGPAFQVGVGASGRNIKLGASGWITGQTLSQPTSGPALPLFVNGDGMINLDADDKPCPADAEADVTAGGVDGGHAFIFAGLGKYVFSSPASWNEKSDGTAALLGSIVSLSTPTAGFDVMLDMSDRRDLGDPSFPPFSSPKLELSPSSYVENGGSIDTLTWHYYVNVVGVLKGTGDFAGASIAVVRVGPALQVGVGANGKNLLNGASSWIEMTTLTQPTLGAPLPAVFGGDMNIDLDAECEECPDESGPDRFGAGGVNAFLLPGIGVDFLLTAPSSFVEKSDGTATLSGVIVRASAPTESFHVELQLSGRIDPSDPSYPPAGSPKKMLDSTAYAENGGPVDTSTWHYYANAKAFLTGLGAFDGALLRLTATGPDFQVGFGANGKNVSLGASGWFVVETLSQPNVGRPFPLQFVGDGNFDLSTDCPTVGTAPMSVVIEPGCPGTGNFVPELRLLGTPSGNEPVALRVRHGLGGSMAILLLGAPGNHRYMGECTVHVSLPAVVVPVPLSLPVGVAGAGGVFVPAVVPPVAAMVDLSIQGFVQDPLAFGGIAASNGLVVTLTP